VDQLNLSSIRAQKARLSAHVGKLGFEIMVALTWLFGLAAVYFFITNGTTTHIGFALLSLTLIVFALAIWDKWDLQQLPPIEKAKSLDDILEPKLLAEFKSSFKTVADVFFVQPSYY
jgi:hypothetical protein